MLVKEIIETLLPFRNVLAIMDFLKTEGRRIVYNVIIGVAFVREIVKIVQLVVGKGELILPIVPARFGI